MYDIARAIEHIAGRWGIDRFENGDCHTLAMALHQSSSPNKEGRTGRLLACLRMLVEESGEVFETAYSHMVYETQDGALWDIGGSDADRRWEDRFDTNSPDKWGLLTRFDWVAVPCSHPAYCDTQIWLQENYGSVDLLLQGRLVEAICAFPASGIPALEEQS